MAFIPTSASIANPFSRLSKAKEPICKLRTDPSTPSAQAGRVLRTGSVTVAEVDGLDEIRADTRLEGTELERIVKPIDQSLFQLPLQGTAD